jgi:hypothetical protein
VRAPGRLGPLRRPVEVAHVLASRYEAAIHLASGEGPEPALDREEHCLVEVAHAVVDVAVVDEHAPLGLKRLRLEVRRPKPPPQPERRRRQLER